MAPRKKPADKKARQKSGEVKGAAKDNRNSEESGASGELVCCTPRGCGEGGTVPLDGGVRMVCTNTKCDQGNFMHKSCFEDYEEYLLKVLVATTRNNRYTDAQRRQSLWTKIWYQTSKFSICKCGGHLRKDLDWEPSTEEEPQAPVAKAGKKKSTEKPSLVGYTNRKAMKGAPKMKVIEVKKNTKGAAKVEGEQVHTEPSCPPPQSCDQSCDQSSESEAGDDDDDDDAVNPLAPFGYFGCSNIPSEEHADFAYETPDMQSYYQQNLAASAFNISFLPASTEDWESETCCYENQPPSQDTELPICLVECFAEWWVKEGWRECAVYMEQQGLLSTKHLISAHELEMTLELTSDPAISVARQLEPWLEDEGWQGFVQHYSQRSEVTQGQGSEFSW